MLHRRIELSALAASVWLLAGPAHGQAIERNLPARPPEPPSPLAAPGVMIPDDDRPIGGRLTGIVLLGASDAPVAAPPGGLDLSRTPLIADGQSSHDLAMLLGRPLSRRLIAEAEAAVVRRYRAQGFPFVAISVPEQDVTGGILQLRVVEFRLGEVTVQGAAPRRARSIRKAVRAAAGEPIDARQLETDIAWLNRAPFVSVQPRLAPGSAFGLTDIQLAVRTSAPVQLYAGYANSGPVSADRDRYFVGAGVALPFAGADLSYQLTGSSDFWQDNDGQPFGGAAHSAYVDQALRLSAPMGPRQWLHVSANYVRTNAVNRPFAVRFTLQEASVEDQFAAPWIAPAADISAGLEVRRLQSTTFFAGIDVLDRAFDVFQAYGAVRGRWARSRDLASLALTVHLSPGGLEAGNDDRSLTLFSQGRATSARYAYAVGEFAYSRILGHRLTLSQAVVGQIASGPLPLSEQISLAGTSLVRGYSIVSGSFDSALVSRTELRRDNAALGPRVGRRRALVSPYVFFDAGAGEDLFLHQHMVIASAGAGSDIRLGRGAEAGLEFARPLRDAILTRAGDWRVNARLRVSW